MTTDWYGRVRMAGGSTATLLRTGRWRVQGLGDPALAAGLEALLAASFDPRPPDVEGRPDRPAGTLDVMPHADRAVLAAARLLRGTPELAGRGGPPRG